MCLTDISAVLILDNSEWLTENDFAILCLEDFKSLMLIKKNVVPIETPMSLFFDASLCNRYLEVTCLNYPVDYCLHLFISPVCVVQMLIISCVFSRVNATWNDLCVVCIAIVLDVMAAARWQTSEHQTCPNVVLPAGLSGFRTEGKQKRSCLRSLRASSPVVVCRSSWRLRAETHPEAEKRGNEDQIQARLLLNRCLTLPWTAAIGTSSTRWLAASLGGWTEARWKLRWGAAVPPRPGWAWAARRGSGGCSSCSAALGGASGCAERRRS